MPRIRTIDLLVDRAEPAPLPKTSLKSDQARAKVVRAARAYAHLGEVKWLLEQLSGSTLHRASASFSPTMAATTCSCTSAPSSVPAWARSMKARSFHMNRSSTACAARPARKTFAPCKALRLRDFPADVPGSPDRSCFQRHEIKARRLNPAGFFVDGHFS